MPSFSQKILNRFDDHMQEVLHGASISFVLKILGAGFGFGLSVILGRLLGASDSGIYFLGFTIVLIVAAIGRLGMQSPLLRFVSANNVAGEIGKVLGVYKKCMLFSLLGSSMLFFILFLMGEWISLAIFEKPELTSVLVIMSLSVVPLSLLTLHAQALQGLKKIVASVLVLNVIVPTVACILILFFVSGYGIDAAAWSYVFATFISLLAGWWFWHRAIYKYRHTHGSFNSGELLASSLPVMGAGMMYLAITWAPLLLLGVWESSESIGIYNAAYRVALLNVIIYGAVNTVLGPKVSELYHQGNFLALNALARKSMKLMFFLSVPILLVCVMFPEKILSIFGEGFEKGASVLMILAIGQFINTACGPVTYLLNMTGHEKLMQKNVFFCLLVGIPLSVFLIESYGVVGAAIATTTMISMQNVISIIFIKKSLNISLFPVFKKL